MVGWGGGGNWRNSRTFKGELASGVHAARGQAVQAGRGADVDDGAPRLAQRRQRALDHAQGAVQVRLHLRLHLRLAVPTFR